MPRNGYWIECIPVQEQGNLSADLYSATSESFPDLQEMAPSPDQAIEKLRSRLKAIRADYSNSGRLLPELDNPVRPPNRLRSISGWISVYVELNDQKA
jgi:hypothetical protein